ncbi:hypothetical protein [Streptomyces xylophagus]|uniref:hypothetical protein n=1 Tax=Streptomyces xylophagus TaxID=285514 RepID=UPI00131EA8CB|nr:hypothetical protein [Streptomyces xylophagus]
MTRKNPDLPGCQQGYFDERQSFAAVDSRGEADWHETVVEMVRGTRALRGIDRTTLRDSLFEVSYEGALDLARLISGGSLLYGPSESLRTLDTERDDCLRETLGTAGKNARFFTNHGHAEDGDQADFLVSSFHVNSLAATTIDVCLIGVSDENIMVLWRFEDD